LIRPVLVPNSGEIARRVLRACRQLGLGTVAVFSEADREPPRVREADQAVAIGPAPARESYLSDPLLFKLIARGASRAEAVERMAAALERPRVESVKTTVPFLRRILASHVFRQGRVHTQMLEQGAFNG